MTEATSTLLRQTMTHVKPVTLRDQVYAEIRQAIFERTLKPGDHIQERELTPLLNISRTPLREALGLLERDGLVQYFPNRGWFVTKYTPPEIAEIFDIRSGLENLAADLIIDRLTEADFAELRARIDELGEAILTEDVPRKFKLDMDFHQRVVELSGNRRLLRMWQNIAVQCSIVFHYHTVTLPDYDHWLAVVDHTAILNALRSREAAKVRAVNNEINRRVAAQCIEGFLAAEGRAAANPPQP